MLENLGYSVVGEAGDGVTAVNLARELQAGPGADGHQDARSSTASARRDADQERSIAPVLLLTAYSDREFVDRAVDAGVMGYLVKPFAEAQLKPAIEVALERWRELRQIAAGPDRDPGDARDPQAGRARQGRADGQPEPEGGRSLPPHPAAEHELAQEHARGGRSDPARPRGGPQPLTAIKLSRAFYDRSSVAVARDLLGKRLVHRLADGQLPGGSDRRDRGLRSAPTIVPPTRAAGRRAAPRSCGASAGVAYVYLIYGMHNCFNMVTGAGRSPAPCWCAPSSRGPRAPGERRAGQAWCAARSSIDRSAHGLDLTGVGALARGRCRRSPDADVRVGPRIGVDYAGEWASAPGASGCADSPSRVARRGINGVVPRSRDVTDVNPVTSRWQWCQRDSPIRRVL